MIGKVKNDGSQDGNHMVMDMLEEIVKQIPN